MHINYIKYMFQRQLLQQYGAQDWRWWDIVPKSWDNKGDKKEEKDKDCLRYLHKKVKKMNDMWHSASKVYTCFPAAR